MFMTDASRSTLEGPIVGGIHGWPFGRPVFDLADRGYAEEEFFLSGEATTYGQVSGTDWGRDGVWHVEPQGSVPFRTRLLVYRPLDPERFNGTVVVMWNNVTAGYELFRGESDEILDEGYAVVAATVQRAAITGFPTNSQGLAAWDPPRYGSLDIPTDDASYDIFTRIGLAVGSSRDHTTPDPLAGLDVRRVIAMGASQSAARLATYINAIHPLTNAYDGFLLQIYFGAGTPLEVGDAIVNIIAPTTPETRSRVGLRGANLIREDVDVPVMVVNSELEAIACYAVRQPDSDRFRYWEAAGTSHGSVQSMKNREIKYQREFGMPPPADPAAEQRNRINKLPLFDAALHHLNRWVDGGEPPPHQPLIEFTGEPPEIVRDEHGIAVGGVRLPQAEMPVAQNSAIPLGEDIQSRLQGSSSPFDATKLEALYGDEEAYVAKFTEATMSAVDNGVLLPRDIAPTIDEARREYRRARNRTS